MYPGTIIEYDDQSAITSLPIATVRNQPLFGSLFTSDKGPEEWTVLSGKDWFDTYGDSISFARHGQPLLQAAVSINTGAKLLSKRLVADDATLANIAIIASVTSAKVQAKNENGDLLYTDVNGLDTIEVTATPKMVDTAVIKYSGKSTSGSKTIKDAFDTVKTATTTDYLLYVVADNGRGTSNKRIKIIPNYRVSKNQTFVQYNMTVSENGTDKETIIFNPNPSMVVDGTNISLQSVVSTTSKQIACIQNDEGINAFIAKIAELTKMDVAEVSGLDFLFGCSRKGSPLTTVTVDSTGLNLQNSYGQAMVEGSNGSFTNSPIDIAYKDASTFADKVNPYVKQAENALDGTFDTCIFNLDQYKIDLIIDANYPVAIKKAIATLVTFREDTAYFRDLGTNLTTLEMIKDATSDTIRNKFIADYSTSYDIIDPYSKKQISVTVGYSLAKLMVGHLNAGRILPVAGLKYGMVITDAIKGTLNFAPTVCPDPIGNQKDAMEDLHVNYASYIGEDLVIETEYTSQAEYTQFSFVNNIIGTEEVVRAIRTRCPAIRYSFIEGKDLEKYKADVEEVILPFQSNFKSLSMEYVADETYTNNKIFYAALKVCHRDFIQTEWFKVIALSMA